MIDQSYTWGVDGYGRQHICRMNEWVVLLCMLPTWQAIYGIELLKEQDENY